MDGALVTLTDEPFVTPDLIDAVIKTVLTPAQRTQLEQDRELTVAYAHENRARFKVTAYYQKGFAALALRLIPSQPLSAAELSLPPVVDAFAQLVRGLIIVVGPFGSGRTSTVAAILQAINERRAAHIVTVERPIEYLFLNNKSVIEQREVGTDTKSFVQALATANREDVDVVAVSELDDPATVRAALEVVEAGRLVIGTMTAESTVQAVERILLSFPPTELPVVRRALAEHLAGILAVRLLPRVGGGRVPAVEVMVPNEAMRSVIRDGALYQLGNILHTAREEGTIPLDRALAQRVKSGEVLLEDAVEYAQDRSALRAFATR